jgi:hypothetical protein
VVALASGHEFRSSNIYKADGLGSSAARWQRKPTNRCRLTSLPLVFIGCKHDSDKAACVIIIIIKLITLPEWRPFYLILFFGLVCYCVIFGFSNDFWRLCAGKSAAARYVRPQKAAKRNRLEKIIIRRRRLGATQS